MDCGEGTQFRLRDLKLGASRVRAIFISHLHGDHYYGLFGLLDSMSLSGRQEPLYLVGPGALRAVCLEIGRATRKVVPFPVHFIDTDPVAIGKEVYADDLIRVESFRLQHGIDCTGYSFYAHPRPRNIRKEKLFEGFPLEALRALKRGEDVFNKEGILQFGVEEYTMPSAPAKRYAYCSDTIYSPDLVDYLAGVDLLYHEATFADDLAEKAHLRGHSTSKQAASIARDSGAKRLLIGHLSSRYKEVEEMVAEARAVFPMTDYAEEGATFSV
jgi:ribonuclease Z